MSNWALLQEQLTGKPVFKRARHGIHFQNPDGSITANFSGLPCHYLEKGIWKPIDTTPLLLHDGWYGCPHSKVRLHPDGRVRVTGSYYQQYTALPSTKKGMLAGDRIIRTFPGGEQHLIITENGFRQEIRVDKPKFPPEKFIASKSGILPSEFKESPLIATDANGESYTFMGDVKAFGDWLDRVSYPVVIDPDFSVGATLGDTLLNGPYPDRNYGGYTYFVTSTQRKNLLRFDLSSISSDAICDSGTLSLYSATNSSTTFNFYKISDANGDWVEGTQTGQTAIGAVATWNNKSFSPAVAWAGSAGLSTPGTDYINTVIATFTGSISGNTKFDNVFNDDGKAVLQSWFGDITNNGLLMYSATADLYIHSSNSATEGYRPVLTVTYAAGGVPKHFMYYARMRG